MSDEAIWFSTDIDSCFIAMNQIRGCQLIFNPVVKIFKTLKSILIEIVNRSCADRDLHLILKMILNSIIGDQLILGHIHGIDL